MLRRFIAVLAFLLAAALLALLAQQRTRDGIDAAAQVEIAQWSSGHTPWNWAPRQIDDAIAGRAFGVATLTATPTGLQITSGGSAPFEIGVPLPRPLPFARVRTATLTAVASSNWHLQFSGSSADGATRWTSAIVTVPEGSHVTTVVPKDLAWQAATTANYAPPAKIAVLRLRFQAPTGSTLVLQDLAWQLDGIDRTTVTLPRGASAEALLQLRDRLQTGHPTWIVAAHAPPGTTATAWPIGVRWLTTALWLVFLTWLLWIGWQRHDGRVTALLEAAAVATPPIVFAVGLFDTGAVSSSTLVVIAATLGYGLTIAWRSRPRAWRWLTTSLTSWFAALLPVALAITWGWSAATTFDWPSVGHVLRYATWAIVQQVLVLGVVATRLDRVLPRQRFAVALLTGVLFALMHTPNDLLMLLCLGAETWWAAWFLRRGAIVPIALAHAAAALLLQAALPGLALRSLEIGARFLL